MAFEGLECGDSDFFDGEKADISLEEDRVLLLAGAEPVRDAGGDEGGSGMATPAVTKTDDGLSMYFSISFSLFQLRCRRRRDEVPC